MNLLAFDTSSTACSVALQHGDELVSSHLIVPMQQAKLILPTIIELLQAANLSLHDLDAIAYGCGPGSFTGIRIAASVAQGLGFAIKRPLIRVSSLAAMAQAAFLAGLGTQFLVAVDARTEQVYWGRYQINARQVAELVGEEQACQPDQIALPFGDNWCGIGDGWEKYAEKLRIRLEYWPEVVNTAQLPSAEALLTIARSKFDQKNWVAPSEAIPVYLR